MMTDSTFECFT